MAERTLWNSPFIRTPLHVGVMMAIVKSLDWWSGTRTSLATFAFMVAVLALFEAKEASRG